MDAGFVRTLVETVMHAKPAPGMSTKVIAVDGPGGAGKSSLADCLARELGEKTVRTDDFASPENPHDWWPQLIENVLEPISHNESARYRPSNWTGDGKQRALVEVTPAEFLILEGVSASRREFKPFLSFSIWIDTPRDLRLKRGLERDGVGARNQWERWMADEDAYIAREDPQQAVDLVLPGDRNLWTI